MKFSQVAVYTVYAVCTDVTVTARCISQRLREHVYVI